MAGAKSPGTRSGREPADRDRARGSTRSGGPEDRCFANSRRRSRPRFSISTASRSQASAAAARRPIPTAKSAPPNTCKWSTKVTRSLTRPPALPSSDRTASLRSGSGFGGVCQTAGDGDPSRALRPTRQSLGHKLSLPAPASRPTNASPSPPPAMPPAPGIATASISARISSIIRSSGSGPTPIT